MNIFNIYIDLKYIYSFSDEKLNKFARSKSSPFPVGYYNWIDDKTRTNPILEVLADQTRHDPDVTKHYDASSLLNDILDALDKQKISWPQDFKRMSPQEWVQKMRNDPIFYFHKVGNADPLKMIEYEEVLLKLSANFLGGILRLVPILEEDSELVIEPSIMIKPMKQYHIAYCNKIGFKNFFISIFPKPSK